MSENGGSIDPNDPILIGGDNINEVLPEGEIEPQRSPETWQGITIDESEWLPLRRTHIFDLMHMPSIYEDVLKPRHEGSADEQAS